VSPEDRAFGHHTFVAIREVTSMSISLKNAAALSIIAAFTITANLTTYAAEKLEQTYVKDNFITASKTTLPLGEGHELAQAVDR
jgi:hypothetical protein